MNTIQFFQHVVKMRHNQAKWFATHNGESLELSKQLERECDAEIARACIQNQEMEKFVRAEFPELIKQIDKLKEPTLQL